MSEPMVRGETAVVTEDWVYVCPYPGCGDVLSSKAGDEFVVYGYITEKQSDSGFAFYRGSVTVEGELRDYLCPADKCERKTDALEQGNTD